MKKRVLTAAAVAALTLNMGLVAMADVVTTDQDYGTEGQKTESPAWNSAANGQFAIEDGKTITFTFDSQSVDASNPAFGWVAEVTDGTSYFTVTQGATAWFAPAGSEWATANTNGTASFTVDKSWGDDTKDAYVAAMSNAKVELVVTRSGNQIIFESKATGSDNVEYTQKIIGVLEKAPEGTLNVQLGSDHGNMTLYKAVYGEAGEVEEATTVEKITYKPSLNTPGVVTDGSSASDETTASDKADSNSDSDSGSDSKDDDDSSNGTMVIVIVVVVLVVAVVGAVLVATKKKKA